MKLGTTYFDGTLPQVAPEQLDEKHGTVANNAKLVGGDLKPWSGPLAIAGVNLGASTVRTLYRFGQSIVSDTQYWFSFPSVVNVVKGPVVDDTEERTYWTDGVYPKKTKSNLALVTAPYPTSSLRMGLPRPTATPGVTVSGTGTSGATPYSSMWVVTYVSSWGEESAPGPASALTTWTPGQTATVTLPPAPTGAYDIASVNLYRTTSGTTSTTYSFHSNHAIGTTSVADTTLDANLGTTLTTTIWDPPPDNMIGLTMMAGEIMAGFFGTTVCFSVPGVPYAWPGAYRQSVPSTVVGICAFDNTLVVGMTRGVMLITGTDPANMTVTPAPAESCVSMRSMVSINSGVMWASPNGLWFAGPAGIACVSRDAYTHDEWQALNPSSIEAYVLDGRYIASYNNGTPGTLLYTPPYVPTPYVAPGPPTIMTIDTTFDAAYVEKATDTMYIAQGTSLYKWAAGSLLSYRWRSKTWDTPSWPGMAYGKVKADTYPVTFRLIADGVQRGPDLTVTSATPFPLPSGRAYTYAFELAGTARVTTASIATNANELGAPAQPAQ